MSLLLMTCVYEVDWAVQGLAESEAGLLEEVERAHLSWEMGLQLNLEDYRICTDDSEETEDIFW